MEPLYRSLGVLVSCTKLRIGNFYYISLNLPVNEAKFLCDGGQLTSSFVGSMMYDVFVEC